MTEQLHFGSTHDGLHVALVKGLKLSFNCISKRPGDVIVRMIVLRIYEPGVISINHSDNDGRQICGHPTLP